MAAHAAKKRRPEDEAEEEMHLAFRGAANALSQVYTQAVAHQRASFLVGERRSLEKVHRWLSSRHEESSEVSIVDLIAYLQDQADISYVKRIGGRVGWGDMLEMPWKLALPYLGSSFRRNEIEHQTENMPPSPQHPSPLQPTYNFPSAIVQSNTFSFGNIAAALNSEMDDIEQTRSEAISDALPNPIRTNFQSNHLIQSSGYGAINSLPNRNGPQNSHAPQNQGVLPYNSYEPAMGMHRDHP
ncbi:hypothetical protein ACP4OV_022171 [Aristida adscensionis]